MERDGLVAQLIDEVGLPVPLMTRRIQGIEHALQRGVRQRANQVQGRRAEGPDRREGLLGLLQRSLEAPDDPAHRPTVEMLRERRAGRHDQEGEEPADVLPRRTQELPKEAHRLRCLVELPQHRPAVDGADGVQPEQERRDDAKVTATAPYRPEEVLVLFGAGGDEAAVRQHQVGLLQVVDGQAPRSRQVAQPAAEGEPTDPGGGDDAAGRRQAKGARRVVHVAPRAAALDPGRTRAWIDADAVHAREIDDQTVVTYAQTSRIVAAATDRYEHAVVASEVHGGDDVRHVHAVRDQAWTPVDHGVVDLPGSLVARVGGLDQLAAQVQLKLLDHRLLRAGLGAFACHGSSPPPSSWVYGGMVGGPAGLSSWRRRAPAPPRVTTAPAIEPTRADR